MTFRQFAGKFRRMRLAETVQKAGYTGLFFGGISVDQFMIVIF